MIQKGSEPGSSAQGKERSRLLPRDFAESAVYYIEQISLLKPLDKSAVRKGTCFDHMSEWSGSEAFLTKRDALYRRLGDRDMIPHLILLTDDLIERVAATDFVNQLLDQVMALPVTLTMFAADLFVHIFTILAFRCGPTNALLHLVSKEVQFDPLGHIFWYATLYLCLVYLFMREYTKFSAKRSISRPLLWASMRNVWTLLDLGAPFIVLLVCLLPLDCQLRASTRAGSVSFGTPYLRLAVAVTTGILWLKLLGRIKMLNRHLATFVLCLFELVKDAKWFLFLIFFVMAAFSQMFVPLMYGLEPSPEQSSTSENKMRFHAYAIMIGDVDSSMFSNGSLYCFFVLYTFTVTVSFVCAMNVSFP